MVTSRTTREPVLAGLSDQAVGTEDRACRKRSQHDCDEANQ
jgi:hypothetical protein